MIAEFSIVPIGKGVHLSEYIAPVVEMIEKSGLDYKITPMGSIVEGDPDKVFDLIRACHKKMAGACDRVFTYVKIDDFKGRTGCITQKIESVEKCLKHKVNK